MERETTEKLRNQAIKDTATGRVNLNIFYEDLPYMKEAYKQKYSKNLNPDTATTLEIKELILRNSLWEIPRRVADGVTGIKKDILKALPRDKEQLEKVIAKLKQIGINVNVE